MPSVPTPSKSGIIETQTGERHIPSSLRPDGTQRKEIKIRPGYKPPEDVEVYKNRTADAWKTRGSGGVPGAEALMDNTEPGTGPSASNKNAKRREARKKAKAAEESGEIKEGSVKKEDWREKEGKAEKEAVEEQMDPEVERQKKAKALVKKLRQANELKEKKEGGAALLPEQFAKVIKINNLIAELERLGFDTEGKSRVDDDSKNHKGGTWGE